MLSQSKNPRIGSAKTFRGLRYLKAQVRALIVILEEFFEHVVDEPSNDALHDPFHDFFDAFFYCACTSLLHRYHPLTRDYCGGVG